MMLFRNTFLGIIALFTLLSCGERAQPEMTLVRFARQDGGRPVSLNKGVMVIAQNTTIGKSLGMYGTDLSSLQSEVFLPNGNYLFYAFGYHGSNPVFNNTFYCGIANGGNTVTLSGGTVDVDLNLIDNSSTACSSIFAPAGFLFGVQVMQSFFYFCGTSFNSSSASSTCTTSPSSYIELALLEDRSLIEASPRPVFRHCYNLNIASSITTNRIPIGPQYKISLRKFSDSNCETTPTGSAFVINGLNNVPTLGATSTTFGAIVSTNNTVYIGLNHL